MSRKCPICLTRPVNSTKIRRWNVSKVTNMHNMFTLAFSFNQDLKSWDVSSVTDMYAIFLEPVSLMETSLGGM